MTRIKGMKAWLIITGSSLGPSVVPVFVANVGPKVASVTLRARAKLPSASKLHIGGVWRPYGYRTRVPSDCLHYKYPGRKS